eukprot:scaffold138856_cov33-Attheya_sp.AAC.1
MIATRAATVPKCTSFSFSTKSLSVTCSVEQWSFTDGCSDTPSLLPATGPVAVDTSLLDKLAVCLGQCLLFKEACPRRLQAVHHLAAVVGSKFADIVGLYVFVFGSDQLFATFLLAPVFTAGVSSLYRAPLAAKLMVVEMVLKHRF